MYLDSDSEILDPNASDAASDLSSVGDGEASPGSDLESDPEENQEDSQEDSTEDTSSEIQESSSGSSGSDYTEALSLLHEDVLALSEQLDKSNYLISSLLFFLVFYWCSNRIKNAVKLFCGRKSNE